MKKLLVLALAFMMLLSVIACSNPTTSDPTPAKRMPRRLPLPRMLRVPRRPRLLHPLFVKRT